MYHIPRFPTSFSVKLIRLSAKTANILLLFTFPFYTITETPDFCMIVYFCLIVRFFPQSPSYQRHPKTKKLGSTTLRDEPHQTSKSLDFKPFFKTFACEYPKSYGINLRLPPGRLLMIVKNLSSNSDHGVHFFDHRVQTDHGVFIFSDHGVQMPLGGGFKSEHPLCRPLHIFKPAPKSNKGFQQHPLCRTPLFSAVSPIFCSCPLYQISSLHFYLIAHFDTILFSLYFFILPPKGVQMEKLPLK